jgi:hypothetical protein
MAQKEDGIYDLPTEPPLMTINLKLSHDNDCKITPLLCKPGGAPTEKSQEEI